MVSINKDLVEFDFFNFGYDINIYRLSYMNYYEPILHFENFMNLPYWIFKCCDNINLNGYLSYDDMIKLKEWFEELINKHKDICSKIDEFSKNIYNKENSIDDLKNYLIQIKKELDKSNINEKFYFSYNY